MGQDILTFLGFYFAGLAVNLTPCVYPMLTVTASLFKPKKNSGETLKHSFSKALAYVLGIALMYSTLGYFAASTGKIFGAVLQNSWVLGWVALMMFALGLSMLGLFQIRIPSEVLNRLSGLRKANYVGLFASGMLVGIFAAPCIGPPVLVLLAAVANHGDPIYGFLAFFVFSLGLGTPYLLLGTFSSLAAKLPKAGSWLIWVEKIFGVILLGFAAFYLALALHWQLPNPNKGDAVWQPYTQQRFEQVMGQHKPVIIDFFAEWCIGCHELDREVFSREEIKAKLSQAATLRVDATKIDDPLVSALIDKYGIIGLPTVLFFDGNGKEIKEARVEGSVSRKEFERSLEIWAKQTKENTMSIKDPQKVRIYDATSSTYSMVDRIVKTDEEWKKALTPEQYRVTREHGTERAFCGLPTKDHKHGIYKCVNCGTDLFLVNEKFESGTGWPSFWQPLNESNVGYDEDNASGMRRVEVHCARCSAHLGHVFDDGPPPTGKRYCINSVALKFMSTKGE